jgi:hypothetical protein
VWRLLSNAEIKNALNVNSIPSFSFKVWYLNTGAALSFFLNYIGYAMFSGRMTVNAE